MMSPRRSRAAGAGRLITFVLALAGAAFQADLARAGGDAPSGSTAQELELMKSQMRALEQKVNAQELRNAEKDSEIKALRQQVEKSRQDLTSLPAYDFLKDVKMSGYVDATMTETFETPADQFNRLRTFDTNAHSFNNEQVKLVFEKATSEDSRAGFRIDMMMGRSARLLGFATADAPAGTSNLDDFELEQAYVTYKADVGNGLDIYGGKFVTLLGAEVLETPLNWNISRSMLFGFAIPFTHTGLRTTYAWNDKWSTTVGVNNGWDNEDDNNRSYSYEGRVAFVPNKEWAFYVNTIYGPEFAGDNSNYRGVIDLVANWYPTEKLSFMANFDWGHQDGVRFDIDGDGAFDESRDAKWWGAAGYVKYAFTDRFSIAGRGEYFSDEDGFRTGVRQNAWEFTVTPAFQLTPKLALRAEYRGDFSNSKFFLDNVQPVKHQNSVLAEMYYTF
jgi:hypothetical protein